MALLPPPPRLDYPTKSSKLSGRSDKKSGSGSGSSMKSASDWTSASYRRSPNPSKYPSTDKKDDTVSIDSALPSLFDLKPPTKRVYAPASFKSSLKKDISSSPSFSDPSSLDTKKRLVDDFDDDDFEFDDDSDDDNDLKKGLAGPDDKGSERLKKRYAGPDDGFGFYGGKTASNHAYGLKEGLSRPHDRFGFKTDRDKGNSTNAAPPPASSLAKVMWPN